MLRKPSLRNPLAYPAGVAPGFDPNHIASSGISPGHGFSALFNGAPVNLLTGRRPTKSGTPTVGIDSRIGPNSFGGAASTNAWSFASPSIPTTADIGITLAGIVITPASYSGTTYFGGTGASVLLAATATGAFALALAGVGTPTSSIILAASAPYFLAGSTRNGAQNYIAARLDTGVTIMGSTSVASTFANTDGTFQFGFRGAGDSNNKSVAALMYCPTFLTLPALQMWAADPWSFWYPRNVDLTQSIYGATAASGFLAAWAQNSNLPVLGTGTY